MPLITRFPADEEALCGSAALYAAVILINIIFLSSLPASRQGNYVVYELPSSEDGWIVARETL